MAHAPLSVAYTPDSDDAHTYYAWEHGRIAVDGLGPAVFHRDHIQHLNEAARAGRFDVVAISAVVYPEVAGEYDILSVGTSVGRNFGPVVVAREEGLRPEDLAGETVAVGGHPTTGSVMALAFCPGISLARVPYDTIADRVKAGEFRAGVMIHEELLHYRRIGLHPVADLGKAWCAQTGLPLPVGLNLVRRSLGEEAARRIATACERSLIYAMEHGDETFGFARGFGRGCAEEHIAMFSNRDTLRLPADARRAIALLFERLGANVPQVRIVEGDTSEAEIDRVCGGSRDGVLANCDRA